MRVLVGCEESGVVRRAFRAQGHDAWSCDLLPSRDDSPFHIVGDVRDLLRGRYSQAIDGSWTRLPWDLGVFHPPCTYLANSGARWLFEKPERWAQLDRSVAFFLALLNAPIPRIAVENPMPHTWATQRIGRRYDFKLHPWEHGDKQKKTTCFWLKNLPPLLPTVMVGPPPEGEEAKAWEAVWREPPGPDQQRNRSTTFPGIAQAMADQWGTL